ncbi:ferritin family protein [bacterium]|nr:ferritin family protein [bacterium]
MSNISPMAIEAIKTAINMEKEGQAFYESWSQKSKDPLAQKMFRKLAEEEKEHLATFQKIFDVLTGSREWREVVHKSAFQPAITVFDKALEKKGNIAPTELEALNAAMTAEREAIQYYGKISDDTDDPTGKEILNKIKSEEEYHYDLLQSQYDYLTKTGFWMDISEFRMDSLY